MAADRVRWNGVMAVREVPAAWSKEDFAYWWLPQLIDPKTGRVLVPARLSAGEKERRTVARSHNMLLVAGVNIILSYVLDQTTTSPGVMFQYLGLGSGSGGVTSEDSSLNTEYYRQTVSGAGVSNFGSNGVISVLVAAGSGTGTITNTGLFGNGASGTLGSGTLMTKVAYLPRLVKGAGQAYTFDYEVSLISN